MNSMTGYAYKEAVADGTQVSVELRSVNSRFLDLSISLPPYLNPLEARLRTAVAEKVVRGKVDLSVHVKDGAAAPTVSVDAAAAMAYWRQFAGVVRAIQKEPGYADGGGLRLQGDGAASDGGTGCIPLSLILQQDGVVSVTHDYDAEAYWHKIEPVFTAALADFRSDRAREGGNLRRDLLAKLDVLDGCAAFFRDWQPQMEGKFRETITARFRELLADHADENRIMQETAALLVKYTINEEIIRLQSHLDAMRAEIERNPAPGKRLDFICQEANREINTIGSKNQFVEVGKKVVDAKDALENIREQAKNVE